MQNKSKIQKTFIIRHKETKELFVARSGKSTWKAIGHAKNAFHRALGYSGGYCEEYGVKPMYSTYHDGSPKRESPKFDEQDIYEIVELKSQEIDLLERLALHCKKIVEKGTAYCGCIEFDLFGTDTIYGDVWMQELEEILEEIKDAE